MSTVLLIEHLAERAETARLLRGQGYDVLDAGTGRDAIDIASRVRPDLMLIDWMLGDRLDGIRVIETLRAIGHMPRSIIMASFPTADLEEDARNLGVAEILAKPVEPERLVSALAAAASGPAPCICEPGPVAVLEISRRGELVHINRRAEELFAQAGYRSRPRFMCDLFVPEDAPDLQAAESRWVAASPSAFSHVNWHIRTQAPRVTGTRLAVVLHANEPHYRHEGVIGAIIGYKPAGAAALESCVLLVDPGDVFRRLNKRMIAAAGIGCHTAGTPAQAVRLVQTNPDISVVVIDLDSPLGPVAELVTELRNARATLQILGASSGEPGQDWTAAGVPLVLGKPWTVGSLVELIGQN